MTCAIHFSCLCSRHDILSRRSAISCLMTLAQGHIVVCTLNLFFQCSPSDDLTSLGLSLFSFIILTGLVRLDPGIKKESCMFVGSWLCVFFVSRYGKSCTYRTLFIHKVIAEQVVKNLVTNKVLFKKYCSKIEQYQWVIMRKTSPTSTNY